MVASVCILPRKKGHKKGGVNDPSNEITHGVVFAKRVVATLMSNDPKTGPNYTLNPEPKQLSKDPSSGLNKPRGTCRRHDCDINCGCN